MSNTHCDSIQHLMVDALFGDIDSAGEAQLKGHLDTCASCSQMFAEMQSTLTVTKQVTVELPPDSYWAGFQQRLDERIVAEQRKRKLLDMNVWATRLQGLFTLSGRPQFTFAYQFGLAVILILVGVLIGRYGFTDNSASSGLASEGVDSTAVRAMQVASQTESYLNRSSVLLLGLVNHDVESDGNTILNFDHKRDVASTLVEDAAVLKASLNPSEEAQLLLLIEELEKILLQIANLELQEDMPGIEMIQHGIEGRALLLKINLETMKLMDQSASPSINELAL